MKEEIEKLIRTVDDLRNQLMRLQRLIVDLTKRVETLEGQKHIDNEEF